MTVEKRQGSFTADGARCEVLDLPGTYSLTSYSPEERIAVREGRWKLIRGPGETVRLYDLGDDPGELSDVVETLYGFHVIQRVR